MLTIRLTRKGKKNQPFFRVVVVDKRRSAKGGRAVEVLGYVDPLTKKKSFKKDRVLHWIKMGAQPSPTIHNLLVAEKIIDAKKIAKHKTKPRSQAAASTAGEPKKETSDKGQEASATASVPVQTTPEKPAVEVKKAESSVEVKEEEQVAPELKRAEEKPVDKTGESPKLEEKPESQKPEEAKS